MKTILSYILIFIAGAGAAFFYFHYAGGNHDYAEMHKLHDGTQLANTHHEKGAHKHDEVNMPGLQGRDTTELEVNDLREIFRSHKGISRAVTNITDQFTIFSLIGSNALEVLSKSSPFNLDTLGNNFSAS